MKTFLYSIILSILFTIGISLNAQNEDNIYLFKKKDYTIKFSPEDYDSIVFRMTNNQYYLDFVKDKKIFKTINTNVIDSIKFNSKTRYSDIFDNEEGRDDQTIQKRLSFSWLAGEWKSVECLQEGEFYSPIQNQVLHLSPYRGGEGTFVKVFNYYNLYPSEWGDMTSASTREKGSYMPQPTLREIYFYTERYDGFTLLYKKTLNAKVLKLTENYMELGFPNEKDPSQLFIVRYIKSNLDYAYPTPAKGKTLVLYNSDGTKVLTYKIGSSIIDIPVPENWAPTTNPALHFYYIYENINYATFTGHQTYIYPTLGIGAGETTYDINIELFFCNSINGIWRGSITKENSFTCGTFSME